MKRFIRIALLAAGAIVALCAIALIGLNLYVQSQGTQARIQQELSQRLGTELHINAVSVTPWGGLTLNGITIPQAWPGNSGDFLTAKSFHLHVSFVSLFSRRLLITKVSLLEPTVVWPQNADGKWRLPGERREETSNVEAATSHSPPPPPQPASPPVEAEATVAPVEPEQPPDAGKRTVASKPRKPTTELIPDVQRLAVTGANFRFLDKSGTMVATFGGVDLHASVHDAATLRGSAKIEKVSLRDRLFLDTLQSPLRYDSKQLELSRISARAAGGNVAGAFTINPETHDSPFSVSVKFREVQADQLVVEAGGPSGVVRGKLEGSFEATGKTSDADALSGTGEIALRDGEVQQYSLLVALGQVLQIEELTQLHLQQAQAKYHVSPGLVTIDELVLRSPNIRLSATGTINFNGKLRLDSQLAINEKVRGQLFKAIRENFRPISEAGYSAIDFQVAGTLDHPKTNLMERLVGRDLKDLVNGLFGGKKSDRPKKKKHAEEAPPATDEASPTPAPEASASSPAP